MNIEELKTAVNAFNHRVWQIVAEKSDMGHGQCILRILQI